MIYKAFIGKHIDLSKVVSISDARFIDRMGSGGHYVGFDMECQLMDNPIHYERNLSQEECGWDGVSHVVNLVNGDQIDHHYPTFNIPDDQIMAVHNLQKQIDDLVEVWKESKK